METNDNVAVTESVGVHVTRDAETAPAFVRVTVMAESGLFKNGQHYPKGSELQMNAKTAQTFAAIGEVQVIGLPEGQTNAA